MKFCLPKWGVSLLTVVIVLISNSAASVAEANIGLRFKSQPDVYQLSPAPLPQIPLGVFYQLQYKNTVDPSTGFLEVEQRDFVLAARDGIGLPITRYYLSGRDSKGISGEGWRWSFESDIEHDTLDTLIWTGFDGKEIEFTSLGNLEFVSYDYGEMLIKQSANGYRLDIGHVTFNYDLDGRLLQQTGLNGGKITYKYQDKNLIEVDLFDRQKVAFNYNNDNLLSAIVLPTGKILNYSYEKGLLTKVIDPVGVEIDYDYQRNLLSKVTYQGKQSIGFEYAADTSVVSKSILSDATEVVYQKSSVTADNGETQTEFSTTHLGRTETYNISPLHHQYTDVEGRVSHTYFHDKFQRLPIKRVEASGRITSFGYNAQGKISSIRNADGMNVDYEYTGDDLTKIHLPRGVQRTLEYDKYGNVVKYTNENNEATKYKYTTLGQLSKVIDSDGKEVRIKYNRRSGMPSAFVEVDGSAYKYVYDDLYRIKTEWLDGQKIASYQYKDEARQLKIQKGTGKDKLWTRINYNEFGHPTKITSSDGKVTGYRYNRQSQLVSVNEGSGPKNKFQYDQFGNLSAVTMPDNTQHRYEYDQLNRLTKIINPQGKNLSYSYNQADEIVSQKVDGRVGTAYSYDQVGRLQSIQFEDQKVPRAYRYNLDSELVEASADGSSIKYGRDIESQSILVNFSKQSLASDSQITSDYKVSWHPDGALKSIVYPSGNTAEYSYFKDGKIASIALSNDRNETQKIKFEYLTGRVKISYPNGVTGQYSGYFDGVNENVETIQIDKSDGEQLALFEYDYDDIGNLVSMGYQQGDKTADPFIQAYSYDDKNQLVGIADSNAFATRYDYDANYNRIREIKSDSETKVVSEYQYELDRLISDGERDFKYDVSGNLIQSTDRKGAVSKYEYTPHNELIKVTKGDTITEYRYDAQGNRHIRINDGKPTYVDYLFDHRFSESEQGERREYIYAPGIDEIVAVNVFKGEQEQASYFYHKDRSNSVVLITDDNGEAANRYAYAPFGDELLTQETLSNQFKYTGRYQEPGLDLYDYRTRFYDADVGRFTTEDRYTAFLGVPASYNRYTYVFNNPNRYRDPKGEFIHIVAGGVIGGAVGYISNGIVNVSTGKSFNEGAGQAILKGTATGAVGAATGGASLIGGAVATGITGTVIDTGFKAAKGEKITAKGFAIDFAFEVTGGVIGGGIANKLKIPQVGRSPFWATGEGSFRQQVASFFRGVTQGLPNTRKELLNILANSGIGAVTGAVLDPIKKAINDALDRLERDGIDKSAEKDSADEDSADEDGADEDGADEDGADEDGADEDGADEDGADEDNADEDGADEDGADEDGADEDGADEDNADEDGADEDGADEDGADEDGADEDNADEDGADEDNADEDNADEDNADEDNADEDNADEDNADEDNADEDNADEDDNDGLNCIQNEQGACLPRTAENDDADDNQNECKSDENCVKSSKRRQRNCVETDTCAEIPPFIWKP